MLSIITPSYNRAKFLPHILDSLCSQCNTEFEWLIIDDGSTDMTNHVVSAFKEKEVGFPVRYFYKENGGKHTAVNLGVQQARGELVLILDSDDELTSHATEIIARRWEETRQHVKAASLQSLAGMAFCMAHRSGSAITQSYQKQYVAPIEACETELRYQYGIQGDICEVFRTDVLRAFPFPEISGERFCPEQLVWFRIAQHYRLRFYDDVVYLRDYLEGGLTDNIVRIRMYSPISSCMTYAEMLYYDIPWWQKIKAAINFFRFRSCIGPTEHHAVPSVRWHWWWAWPIGSLLHARDWRSISKL